MELTGGRRALAKHGAPDTGPTRHLAGERAQISRLRLFSGLTHKHLSEFDHVLRDSKDRKIVLTANFVGLDIAKCFMNRPYFFPSNILFLVLVASAARLYW